MPSTQIPNFECTQPPEFDGPTLIWPWDGADDEWYESALQSRLFQMIHNQPGATIGTGSWALEGTVFPGKRLRDIGWRKSMNRTGDLNVSQLQKWGYEHVIIDKKSGYLMTRVGRDSAFKGSKIQMECTNVMILDLD
jgi:hypothetical protein